MKRNTIEMALENITVGMTTTLNGHVVTRWNLNRYEVDTCNRTSCSFDEAVEVVSL